MWFSFLTKSSLPFVSGGRIQPRKHGAHRHRRVKAVKAVNARWWLWQFNLFSEHLLLLRLLIWKKKHFLSLMHYPFLVTETRLYTLPCRSVRPSVRHISEFRAVFAFLPLPNRPRLHCRVSDCPAVYPTLLWMNFILLNISWIYKKKKIKKDIGKWVECFEFVSSLIKSDRTGYERFCIYCSFWFVFKPSRKRKRSFARCNFAIFRRICLKLYMETQYVKT